MSGWSVVCVFVHACIHIYTYKSMRECLRMCYLRLSLYVWIYKRMNVCVYTIHIYAFLLYSEAVFHGSGTFILRSTVEYLAAHFVFNIWLWTTGSCHSLHQNLQQCTSRRCACPLPFYNRPCCHISQSASSHDREYVIYKCWCFERHSTFPYDNMAT